MAEAPISLEDRQAIYDTLARYVWGMDTGDIEDLGARYAALRAQLPQLSVLGGCCGTDARHIDAIRRHCMVEGPHRRGRGTAGSRTRAAVIDC